LSNGNLENWENLRKKIFKERIENYGNLFFDGPNFPEKPLVKFSLIISAFSFDWNFFEMKSQLHLRNRKIRSFKEKENRVILFNIIFFISFESPTHKTQNLNVIVGKNQLTQSREKIKKIPTVLFPETNILWSLFGKVYFFSFLGKFSLTVCALFVYDPISRYYIV
jgi:hypothetical protein